jgi:glycosyltransferase involved in cell wall biosynthesis
MRIAFITHQFPHLANTFILNEITQILRMGHDVTVYSLDRSDDEVVNTDVASYGLQDRTRYFLDYIVEDPGNRATYRAYSPERLEGYLHSFPQIGKELQAEGIQIIHAAFGNRPCTAALALAELTGIPLTFESHARDLFVDFYLAQEKISLAERVFTISDYNKRYLMEEHGCPEEKLVVRRVSIVEEFCDRIRGEPKRDDLLITVCRLHPIKGIQHALQALDLVRETHGDVRLHIIGEGDLQGELEAQAAVLGLDGSVVFEGPLNNQDALRYVNSAAVFLLPSLIAEDGDRDGIPTALIESMYLETPAVSTTVSGIPELIDDGEDGYLVEPGDVEGLADRVRLLLDDPERRAEMGRKAREKVKADFDAARNTRKVLDAWAEVLAT